MYWDRRKERKKLRIPSEEKLWRCFSLVDLWLIKIKIKIKIKIAVNLLKRRVDIENVGLCHLAFRAVWTGLQI